MILTDLGPATLPSSAELDALIAEKWMEWSAVCSSGVLLGWHDSEGEYRSHMKGNARQWSPSTNPAHAGEARREARAWTLWSFLGADGETAGFQCYVNVGGWKTFGGRCEISETNGDKGRAEALATTRAIVAALQAARGDDGNQD